MTSARLTISTASDRLRALRFNSRLSGGAKTTLPKPMPTNIQHGTQRVTDLLHYHYFQTWQNSGVWVHLHRVLYEQARRIAGRAACPSVVIMDGHRSRRPSVVVLVVSTRTSA